MVDLYDADEMGAALAQYRAGLAKAMRDQLVYQDVAHRLNYPGPGPEAVDAAVNDMGATEFKVYADNFVANAFGVKD